MRNRQFRGTLLVGAQMVLIVAMLTRVSGELLRPPALAGVVGAMALMGWAVASVGFSRVRVRPEPAEGAQLCTRGPYRWIRHPMYTAVLLLMLSVVLANPVWWALGCWVVLFAVLWCKLRHEEEQWLVMGEEYAGYMKRTKRLVPWVL